MFEFEKYVLEVQRLIYEMELDKEWFRSVDFGVGSIVHECFENQETPRECIETLKEIGNEE